MFGTKLDLKMSVFWDAVPCGLIETNRCFRGASCLHHQGDDRPTHGPTSQNTSSIYVHRRRENLQSH
jgi:hypothetical protein